MDEYNSKRVMVILVGGRLTPNFIGILHHQPSIVECIVSEDEASKYSDVLEVLTALPNIELALEPRYLVSAFDLEQTLAVCQKILEEHKDAEVIFNITAATKIMGIAAYEAAKQAGVPAIYVDTMHGLFINLTGPQASPAPINIKLQEYLRFFGRSPSPTFAWNQLTVSPDTAVGVAAQLAMDGEASRSLLSRLRPHWQGKGKRTVTLKQAANLSDGEWTLLETLNDSGMISQLQRTATGVLSFLLPNDANCNFLNGTWLEIYVWDQARKCSLPNGLSLFSDCDFSFEIPSTDGTRKEIDVGCIYQGQLIHVTCKTEKAPFSVSYLDEVRAVSSLVGGRYCSRLFVTNSSPPSDGSGGWQDYQRFLDQANARQIVVVTGDQLSNVRDVLYAQAIRPKYWRI